MDGRHPWPAAVAAYREHRRDGTSVIEAVRLVREAFGLTIPQAKEIVVLVEEGTTPETHGERLAASLELLVDHVALEHGSEEDHRG
jgi:hypothetical protein